jgi:hypothetical protein
LFLALSFTSEPARVNRHLEQTLREAGFAALFTNNFFHSAVLYTEPQPLEVFRSKLLALAAHASTPAATRAALGFMARTTVEARAYPRHYQPFTDEWAPELMLELKSNHAQLYAALAEHAADSDATHPAVRIIRERLCAERAAGVTAGAITAAQALVPALTTVTAPLTAADAAHAARYLRFDYVPLGTLDPRTPWAQLAATYARLYAAANANDYEALEPLLRDPPS